MQEIDIIIPVYKPGSKFLELIERLEHQSIPVHQILLFNTEQKYWEAFQYDHPRRKRYENVKLWHISRKEFDHGRTRREAVKKSKAPVFVMMTDDAMPADEFMLERLVAPLSDSAVAVSYARQLPREEAGAVERFTREFNYPPVSRVKSKEDLPELGIKTYFCSDVCAAYRRDIYDKQGGFLKHAIFNEDMVYAAGCIRAGYRIAYTAEAEVIHSHQYTNKEQFRRNFDMGVSQAEHPEIFAAYPSESEGIRFVRQMIRHLREAGFKRKIPHVLVQSGFKYAGYLLGKHYRSLPGKLVVRMSNSKEYWS